MLTSKPTSTGEPTRPAVASDTSNRLTELDRYALLLFTGMTFYTWNTASYSGTKSYHFRGIPALLRSDFRFRGSVFSLPVELSKRIGK